VQCVAFGIGDAPSVGAFQHFSVANSTRGEENETDKQGFRVQHAWNKVASWRAAVKETYIYNQEKEVYAKLPNKSIGVKYYLYFYLNG